MYKRTMEERTKYLSDSQAELYKLTAQMIHTANQINELTKKVIAGAQAVAEYASLFEQEADKQDVADWERFEQNAYEMYAARNKLKVADMTDDQQFSAVIEAVASTFEDGDLLKGREIKIDNPPFFFEPQ